MKNILNKFVNIFLAFGLLFSLLPLNIYAQENDETKLGIVKSTKGNGINVRSSASTKDSQNIIGTGIADDQIVTIYETLNTIDDSSGCSSGIWYKIKYLQVEEGYGYACSNFIQILDLETNDEFEASLLTFPESYRTYLRALHNIYPNAVFRAYNTGLDFNEVVKNENIEGKNLLWDSNNSRDGLKLLSSYNISTNSFKNNYPGGGSSWYAPNEETIAYYIDPRNFLNETRVFMFESLSYNSMYHNIEGVEAILKSSFMYDTYVDGVEDKKFSEVIIQAGITYSVSPYYIASRILQETGNTRSSLVLGTYPKYSEYNGYYNFYNFGATGTEIVKNGLKYAYNSGWDSEEKAITGGASLLGAEYINAGQDTNYFQKWNVVCKTGDYSCYTHQYMQNIEAPYSEAKITYNAYKNNLGNDMYNIGYVFTIPVYENMPEITILPNEVNPINYLSSLSVNNNLVNNFNSLVYDYSITIPSYMKTIDISATSVVNGAIISGGGNITIIEDKQVIPIIVKALNGNTLTYNITVNINDDYEMTLDDTLTNIKNNIISDNYIYDLTTIDKFKEIILNTNSTAIVEVKNVSGEIIETGTLKTGDKIKIIVSEESKELEVVLYGDVDGDGKISAVDYSIVKNYIMGNLNLEDSYKLAADVNNDDSISAVDYSNIKNYIMGNDSVIKK